MPDEVAEYVDDKKLAMDVLAGLFVYKNTDGKVEIATFDAATPEGAEKLINGMIGELPKLQEQANLEIYITDFLMHEASKVEPNGELNTWQRIVVYDDKGKAFDCGSIGVKKCIEIMLRVRKGKHFDPPVKCVVKVEHRPGPKVWMTLQPDIDSLLNRTPKKRK